MLQQLVGAGQQQHPDEAAPAGLGMGSLEPGDKATSTGCPVSRSNAPTNRPPLIPLRRRIRHTDSSIPPASDALTGQHALADTVDTHLTVAHS